MAIKASATITLFDIVEIDSVTIYYLLQSSTSAAPAKPTTDNPGGNWSTTEPTYTEGSTNTLYTVTKTKYSDGTFEYTPVSKSSSYEAAKIAYNKAVAAKTSADGANDKIDNLEIGSRNLLLKTRKFEDISTNYTSSLTTDTYNGCVIRRIDLTTLTSGYKEAIQYPDIRVNQGIDFKANDIYTFSFWIRKLTDSCNMYCYFYGTGNYAKAKIIDSSNGITGGFGDGSWALSNGVNSLPKNKWVRAWVTWQIENASDTTIAIAKHILIRQYYGSNVEIAGCKFEKGTKPTDWTPAPEDVEASIDNVKQQTSEVVVGTQTAATGSWTGVASLSSLKDKQQITYWLPYAGSGDATLNLTLANGTTTGAIPCYYSGTTRLTTHYAAGNAIHLTYRENVTIGTTTIAKGWWADANYNTNDNTYDRIRYNNNIKAKTAITASTLIVGDSSGYFKLVAGSVFDIDKPILWAGSAISAAATGTNNYLSMPSCTMRNNTSSSWTATQYETLYLVGKLDGQKFTVDSSATFLTTVKPIYDDGKYYISLGYMYSTYQIYLYPEHPIFKYVDGAFKNLNQVAYEAQNDYNNLEIGGRNYILRSSEEYTLSIPSGTNKYTFRALNISDSLKELDETIKTFTISFDAYSQNGGTRLQGYLRGTTASPMDSVPDSGISTTEWKRYSITKTIKDGYTVKNIINFYLRIEGDSTDTVYFKNIKVEVGNKATDWTPAPEDVDADISAVSQKNQELFEQLQTAAGNATYARSTVDSLQGIIQNIVKDDNGLVSMSQTGSGLQINMTKVTDDIKKLLKEIEDNMTSAEAIAMKTELQGAIQAVQDRTAYINASTDASGRPIITLGATNSPFKVQITNEAINFVQNGEVIAYANGQAFYNLRTVVQQDVQIGIGPGYIFKTRANGNMGLTYVPG